MGRSVSSIEHKLEKSFRLRLYFFSGIIVMALIIFIFQLFNLQIVNGSENSRKAEMFVRRSESLPASRGLVFDRNFKTPEDYAKKVSSFNMEIVEKVWRNYEEELLKQKSVDFDDLIVRSVSLLK